MIACCHPGKIGDALYTLPTIRALSKKHNCKVDFYTSSYCGIVLELFENQTEINKAQVLKSYTPIDFSCGGQPWEMNIPNASDYEYVYQLGFRSVPDKPLPEFIAESAGFDRSIGKDIRYDIKYDLYNYPYLYIVIAPRGINQFTDFFDSIIISYPNINFVILGAKNENPFKKYDNVFDHTDCDFMGMSELISKSVGFVGLMSAPLVIANGFNIPKYIPYTEYQWDMRHIVIKPESKYTTNYSVIDCINWIKKEI